jgi:ABC-type antimicrobial peptide transport system permease subunit
MERHRLLLSEMFRLSLRNFKIKPVRSILTILGMSVGFGVVLFLVSLGYGLQYILIGNLVTTQDSLVTIQASYPSEVNLYFYPQDVAKLAALPHVAEVTPVASFSGQATLPDGTHPALIAMDIADQSYFRLMGTGVDLGHTFVAGTPGLVVTSQTLALLGLSTSTPALGQPLLLSIAYEDDIHGTTTNAASNKAIPVVGIISDDTQAPLIILDPADVSPAPPFYTTVLVKADSVKTVETVRDELVNQGLSVSARIDLVNQATTITNIITLVLGVFGITALIVSAIGMFNTMLVSFMERTYEVGVLKSLGATDGDVRNLFLLESAIIGFMGGAGGVIGGFLAGQAVNLGVGILAAHLGGKGFSLFITPLWFAALIIGLSILIGLISGFWPAYQAAHLSAKEAFLQR